MRAETESLDEGGKWPTKNWETLEESTNGLELTSLVVVVVTMFVVVIIYIA